jgi:hypothetical protein
MRRQFMQDELPRSRAPDSSPANPAIGGVKQFTRKRGVSFYGERTCWWIASSLRDSQ